MNPPFKHSGLTKTRLLKGEFLLSQSEATNVKIPSDPGFRVKFRRRACIIVFMGNRTIRSLTYTISITFSGGRYGQLSLYRH